MKYLKNFELCSEIFIRVLLIIIYNIIGFFNPLERHIQPEELWLYRYPITKSYFPMNFLLITIFSISSLILLTNYILTHNKKDLEASILALTLSIFVTATLSRLLKFITGRPRPDFYWRSLEFSSQGINFGNHEIMKNGRQSFPSAHASISFASFGFISLYLMGKLKVRQMKGCGNSWRLLACLLPIVFASIIGISRICDYHHHASDVIAGSLLGSFVSLICYHFYYPPFYNPFCEVPYDIDVQQRQIAENN